MWHWFKKYRYSIIFILSVTGAIICYWLGLIDRAVLALGPLGYGGAFLAGMFFATSFGGAAGALFLLDLGGVLNPYLVVVIGGFGAMLADLVIYEIIKDGLLEEIKLLLTKLIPIDKRDIMERISKKRFFLWGLPFLASFLIASPLPDELGVALFGVINFKPKYLSLITFLLNTTGIFIIVMLGHFALNLN